VNFGPLAAEIVSLVWGTPGNFNGFRVLAALLHGTLVVGVIQTAALNRGRHLYSEGGHHVGHWPTFLVCPEFQHLKLSTLAVSVNVRITRKPSLEIAPTTLATFFLP